VRVSPRPRADATSGGVSGARATHAHTSALCSPPPLEHRRVHLRVGGKGSFRAGLELCKHGGVHSGPEPRLLGGG